MKMKTNMKKAVLSLGVVVALVIGALAMPTKEELSEAQPLVNELMTPLANKYKSGKMSAKEVGDKAVEFSGEAETQAAKYLFLKGSVAYYVRDKSYDKAADAIESIMAQFPDIEPETLLDITTRAKRVVTSKTAPRLVAIHNTIVARVNGAKALKAMESELKKNPTDKALVRSCAELTAATGKWDEALSMFAKLGGDTGKMAQGEIDGTAATAVLADFWWNYKPQQLGAKDAIRSHAVSLYRAAIDRDELKGLQKTLAEQRMAEAGTAEEIASPQKRTTPPALSAEMQQGLVGYWPFDGNAKDATKNRNNGTLHNVTQTEDRHGNANKAYRFSGSSYIEVPHSKTLNMTHTLTMTAWIKPHDWWQNQWIVLMQKGDREKCNYHPSIKKNVVFLSWPDRIIGKCSQVELELNKWQQIALTYESGKSLRFYRNGFLISTWQFTKDLRPNNCSLFIGCDPLENTEYFIGDMDDVRLFNRALSEKEIQELYKAEAPIQ